jgi:hypothetical protein
LLFRNHCHSTKAGGSLQRNILMGMQKYMKETEEFLVNDTGVTYERLGFDYQRLIRKLSLAANAARKPTGSSGAGFLNYQSIADAGQMTDMKSCQLYEKYLKKSIERFEGYVRDKQPFVSPDNIPYISPHKHTKIYKAYQNLLLTLAVYTTYGQRPQLFANLTADEIVRSATAYHIVPSRDHREKKIRSAVGFKLTDFLGRRLYGLSLAVDHYKVGSSDAYRRAVKEKGASHAAGRRRVFVHTTDLLTAKRETLFSNADLNAALEFSSKKYVKDTNRKPMPHMVTCLRHVLVSNYALEWVRGEGELSHLTTLAAFLTEFATRMNTSEKQLRDTYLLYELTDHKGLLKRKRSLPPGVISVRGPAASRKRGRK